MSSLESARSSSVESVWAVVTSFHPDDLGPGIARLAQQTDGVIVVDDGSGPAATEQLDHARASGAEVVALPENMGIAAALNAGIRRAFERGADAVVTFDQDSSVDADFVSTLVTLHDDLVESTPGGVAVVPQFFAGVDQTVVRAADGRLAARNPIQSGMLLPRSVVDAVGLFREDFFIDLVDTEYALRCASAGVAVMGAPGLRLHHRLGARYRAHGWPLRRLGVLTLSAPFRYYYRMRNRILLEKEYLPRFRSRLLRDGLIDRAHFLIVLLLARPRSAMWDTLRSAARDGRRGVGGRMPAAAAARARAISWDATRDDED